LRPGLTVRMLESTPQNGFAKVRTAAGLEGWVSVDHVRPIAALDAEQALESLGGLEAAGAARGPGPIAFAAAAPCKPFNQCPVVGCATDAAHKLTNRRKRTFPSTTKPARVLSFESLRLLQEETDHRGVPQGEHLSQADRALLRDIDVGGVSVSEGNLIAVTGFIAKERNLRCGGAESVNCRHHNGSETDSACTRSDIHIPVVENADGTEFDSIVVEPIPQGPDVKRLTPAALREVQESGRRVLIRGGLFYDSIHIVNTGEGPQNQPKRFTVWELHPVTAVLVCSRADNKCDPANDSDWKPLSES
jgi:hypothetical protein